MRNQTILLIVGFLGLVGCALTIAVRFPIISFSAFQQPNSIQIWTRNGQHLQLDLSTGDIKSTPRHQTETYWEFPDAKVRITDERFSQRTQEPKWIELEATVIDHHGAETHHKLQLPEGRTAIEFLDSSTAVCTSSGTLYVVDLGSPSQTYTYPLSKLQPSTANWEITSIPNSKRSIAGSYLAPDPTDRNWLLDASDPQNIALITSWPAGIGTTIGDDCVYESKADKSAITRHSLVDGSDLGDLVLSPEIQSQFDPSRGEQIEVIGRVLFINRVDGYACFDLYSQAPYKLGRSDLIPMRHGLQFHPIVLFFSTENSPRNIVAYDSTTQQISWEVSETSDYTTVGKQAPDTIVLGTDQYGLSVDVIDTRTGKSLQTFTPFRYLAWLLAFTEIGFAVWIIAWLNSSVATLIPPWLNTATLAIIALALLLSFNFARNWWSEITTVPAGYCQGVFLGLATSYTAWLVLGQTRLGTRYLSVLTIAVLLIAYARWVSPDNSSNARTIVSLATLHATAAFIAFSALRLLRFRIHTQATALPNAISFTLRDLFILSAAVAVVVVAAKPIMALDLPTLDKPRLCALIAFAAGSASMLAVYSNNRFLFTAACVIAAAIYVAMFIESLFQFVTGLPLFISRDSLVWHWFRISTAGLVTSFVVNFAYRSTAVLQLEPAFRVRLATSRD